MAYITREQIETTTDYRTAEVDVPEWGGSALVRELTAEEAESVGFPLVTAEGKVDARKGRGMLVKICAMGMIDEDGNQLFSPKSNPDLRMLGSKARAPIERIAKTIMDLSGMTADEADESDENGDDGDPNE